MTENSPMTAAKPQSVPRVQAAQLLGQSKVVHIEHNDEVYTLRLTRNGRLILTK